MKDVSSIRFAPSILMRLGEELVPNLDQAIVELIRNSYDADATYCSIKVSGTRAAGGTIVLSDNGDGMSLEGIRDGWLVLGGSSKESKKITGRLGRRTVGDKGLGRLAALRAGQSASLLTRTKDMKPEEALHVQIKWEDFESAKVVESVPLTISTGRARDEIGTTISLVDLRRHLTSNEIDRLGRSIVLLTSPFPGESDFRVDLSAPDYPELEARVRLAYLQDAEYVLTAELNSDGFATAKVKDWKGTVLYGAPSTEWFPRQKEYKPTYDAPPAQFELYNYVLRRNAFAGRDATIGEVKDWLKVVGGVHFYHRKFRVPPYGDPGHDWLDMNLARARSPEERPSTNTSVGRVTVDDPDGLLVQKTDRVGFIESYQFMEIRRFAKDALEWFARRRLQDAETRREVHRQESNRVPAAARADLIQQISEAMPADNRQRAMKALESLEKGYTKAIEATREDLLLYRSLATAGTTAAVFAHEIGKPISSIISSQKRIRARSAELKPREKAENLKGPLDVIVSQAEKLKNFSGMQIDFLRREKRRHGAIDVNSVISNLHRLWQPILKDAKISLRLDLHNEAGSVIFGAEALIETIITNCLTNAVRAFEEPGARTRDREVIIRSIVEGQTIAIEIEDNGPGFGMSLDDIWLPGKTTHHSGTGFGLTIAKDSALDLGGTYSATSGSRELGAKFRFVFQRFQSDAH